MHDVININSELETLKRRYLNTDDIMLIIELKLFLEEQIKDCLQQIKNKKQIIRSILPLKFWKRRKLSADQKEYVNELKELINHHKQQIKKHNTALIDLDRLQTAFYNLNKDNPDKARTIKAAEEQVDAYIDHHSKQMLLSKEYADIPGVAGHKNKRNYYSDIQKKFAKSTPAFYELLGTNS